MRSITNLIALLLIALGVISFAYAGFTYTKEEEVAEIGSIKISNEERKFVPFSPAAGGVMIAVGVVILLANRKRR